jgi:hypothetical protein
MGALKERMIEIGKGIITQNNRITDAPLFGVERLRRDYGYNHEYADEYSWFDTDNEHDEASDLMAERLDSLEAGDRDWKGWKKIYYKERWEFVMACFTEQGCKDYLEIDGHNLGKTRIYAYGSHRNTEYRQVREYLKSLHNKSIS